MASAKTDHRENEPYFLRHPGVAVALIVMGLVLFGLTAYSLFTHSLLNRYDEPLFHLFRLWYQEAPGWGRAGVQVLTDFGNYASGAAAGFLFLFYLLRKHTYRLFLVLAALGGQGLLQAILVYGIHRPRPPIAHQLSTPSYPSGHAVIAASLYTLLLYLFLPSIRSSLGRAAAIAGAVVLALAIGFARLLAGAHYLTDIIAGYGIALAWTTLALTAVGWYFYRVREGRRREGEPAGQGAIEEQ